MALKLAGKGVGVAQRKAPFRFPGQDRLSAKEREQVENLVVRACLPVSQCTSSM